VTRSAAPNDAPTESTPRARRRRWVIFSLLFLGILAAGAITLAFRLPWSGDRLRQRVIDSLAYHLDAEVELADLRLHVAPRMSITGSGLTIRHKGRRDVPPLISVEQFAVNADMLGLWNKHVAHVRLDGLVIQVPPGDDDHDAAEEDEASAGPHVDEKRQVVVDTLEAPDARLIILRRDPAKPPRVWQMHALRVESVSDNTAMPFEASLTNAVPPGSITTTGVFGPWHRDDPGHTPIDGEFVFENADLSVFKGISGILSAHGTYNGSLERIAVNGETETPDFTVSVSGQPVPLKARYRALVDGTNGNTTLEQVDATFLETSLVAKGGVYEVDGVKGRVVQLDVAMDKARLEDVLRLAVKSPKPPMTGALKLATKFELPPGDRDVVEKLQLDGRFSISGGRFTNPEVQQKINEMSLRASGRLKDVNQNGGPVGTGGPKIANVASDFEGRFKLADAVLALPVVAFDIPGAAVRLAGAYNLEAESLDFSGNLYMDAKVSQTVTGWKSWLLKIADPLFRKEGRTVVPLKIAGTRGKPQFGIDFKRVL
jgi:hypothetical protein